MIPINRVGQNIVSVLAGTQNKQYGSSIVCGNVEGVLVLMQSLFFFVFVDFELKFFAVVDVFFCIFCCRVLSHRIGAYFCWQRKLCRDGDGSPRQMAGINCWGKHPGQERTLRHMLPTTTQAALCSAYGVRYMQTGKWPVWRKRGIVAAGVGSACTGGDSPAADNKAIYLERQPKIQRAPQLTFV